LTAKIAAFAADFDRPPTRGRISLSEQIRFAICAVGRDDLPGETVADCALDHAERQLDLRLESQIFRDLGGRTPRRILGPRGRQIEC